MIKLLVPDRDARIIDWGGLYGHVTQILRLLGYRNVTNYLLHASPHYPLFRDRFGIATVHGQDPNRLNLADASADVFISSGVLEHVREDGVGREDLVLRDVHRVL